MSGKFFINAHNVHQGGGLTLLLSLLNELNEGMDSFAVLDARILRLIRDPDAKNVYWVHPSIYRRLLSEWRIFRQVAEVDFLLCFGNLPPLFRSRGHVAVFLQNCYLIKKIELASFPLRARWRIRLERLWFSMCIRNVDLFIVQTPTMERILQKYLAGKACEIVVLPFSPLSGRLQRRAPESNHSQLHRFDFIYVASGDPHKNHHNLIRAWEFLAKEGMFPSLCLTVDDHIFTDLCNWIDSSVAHHKLKITNLGSISHAEVQLLYRQARALIYPSKHESFGLPLIEARQAELPVIAPEADYVRDLLDPEETFDPDSPVSIALSVQRFLGLERSQLLLLDASGFVDAIKSSLR